MRKIITFLLIALSLSLSAVPIYATENGNAEEQQGIESKVTENIDDSLTSAEDELTSAGEDKQQEQPDTSENVAEQIEKKSGLEIIYDTLMEDYEAAAVGYFEGMIRARTDSEGIYNICGNDVTEEQLKIYKKFIYDFYNLLKENVTEIEAEEMEYFSIHEGELYCYCKVRFMHLYFSIGNEYMWVKDELLRPETRFENKYFRIDDPIKLAEFIQNYDWWFVEEKEPTVKMTGVDVENRTYDGREMEIVEELTFDFELKEENYRIFFPEIANVGERIKCKIEQFRYYYGEYSSDDYLYLFTFEGSKGKNVYWDVLGSNFGYTYTKGKLSTYINAYYENNTLYLDGKPVYKLSYSGNAENGSVTDVQMRFSWQVGGPVTMSIKGENIKYKFYKDDFNFNRKRNLVYLFGMDEAIELDKLGYNPDGTKKEDNEEEKEVKEIDYTRYEKKLKSVSDRYVFDYNISFLTKNKLDIDLLYAPEWYKNLGDNVTVTVMGLDIVRIFKGEPMHPTFSTMVYFEGDEGGQWFELNSSAPSENLSNESKYELGDLYEDQELVSLISFDGVTVIQNLEEYDTVNLRFNYSYNDGTVDFDGIDFRINSEIQEVSVEDMKYIGAGKTMYENYIAPYSLLARE